MARQWVSQGATYLHLVDLDGARQGHPVNGKIIQQIVASAGVPCQLGGGLRNEDHLQEALEWGIDRVVVGTKALEDPGWFEQVCARFPRRVILGIDARNGQVATGGWLKVSDCSALDLARRCADWPLAALIYTDISRDGMLGGPNLEAIGELAVAVSLPVIASGGVSTREDIRQLARLKLAGCIIGRALYEGKLELSEAIRVASG